MFRTYSWISKIAVLRTSNHKLIGNTSLASTYREHYARIKGELRYNNLRIKSNSLPTLNISGNLCRDEIYHRWEMCHLRSLNAQNKLFLYTCAVSGYYRLEHQHVFTGTAPLVHPGNIVWAVSLCLLSLACSNRFGRGMKSALGRGNVKRVSQWRAHIARY